MARRHCEMKENKETYIKKSESLNRKMCSCNWKLWSINTFWGHAAKDKLLEIAKKQERPTVKICSLFPLPRLRWIFIFYLLKNFYGLQSLGHCWMPKLYMYYFRNICYLFFLLSPMILLQKIIEMIALFIHHRAFKLARVSSHKEWVVKTHSEENNSGCKIVNNSWLICLWETWDFFKQITKISLVSYTQKFFLKISIHIEGT